MNPPNPEDPTATAPPIDERQQLWEAVVALGRHAAAFNTDSPSLNASKFKLMKPLSMLCLIVLTLFHWTALLY